MRLTVRFGFIAGVLLALLVLVSLAQAAGELDSSFDGDGKAITDFGGVDTASGVAIQSDGKIVTAGSHYNGISNRFALARYNADGGLDPSFDGDGKVITDFGGDAIAIDVAIQADGKVVAAGKASAGANPSNFALARYNADGSLDPSFGGDGTVVTDVGASDGSNGVAIQSDGKIVAGGVTNAGINPQNFALARYNSDGSLDSGFDGDGTTVTDFGGVDSAARVAIQSDGRIVAVGRSNNPFNFELARYNTDGSLDATFSGDGKVVTDFTPSDSAADVAIQADGKIVAAGSVGPSPGNFGLARYNANGSLDATFDGDGKVVTDFGSAEGASGVTIQSDGKIVAVGQSDADFPPPNFALARYNANGSLDMDFGGDGTITTDFGAREIAYDVALQGDGKLVAAGQTCTCTSENPGNFALARYLPTGAVQPTISVRDVKKLEGNAGLSAFGFKISLSNPSSQPVTVVRQTANGSATAASDYTALAPSTMTFSPGQTARTVTVDVKGEVAVEPNETFFLNLSSPTNATIADGQGMGTILNDDLSDTAPCTITGTNRNDVLTGTPGKDVICAGKGDDQIHGGDGADVLKGESGNDLLVGDFGNDLLIGGAGADDLDGDAGNDTMRGGDGDDTLRGITFVNSDALFGDAGADSLDTQDNRADDSADGGTETDSCIFDPGDFVTNCP